VVLPSFQVKAGFSEGKAPKTRFSTGAFALPWLDWEKAAELRRKMDQAALDRAVFFFESQETVSVHEEVSGPVEHRLRMRFPGKCIHEKWAAPR